MDIALRIENLKLEYGNKEIFANKSLVIKQGQIVGIVGPSGSGKTSFLKCISGIIPKLQKEKMSGDIWVFSKNMQKLDAGEITKELGIVFQSPDYQLFFNRVYDELAFGMENLCIPQEEMMVKIDDILEVFELQEHKYSNPSTLSGGVKQLIVLASILLMNPRILLLDECLSQVDKEKKNIALQMLSDYRDGGGTIVLVEHDEEVLAICDQIEKGFG